MKKLWPELLVFVLFLLGDLLWDGLALAAAGVAAGFLAFGILLLFRKKKPGLIVEGLLFGGITALGELVDYPGGTLILMELVLGLILMVSVLSGKNIISKMTGGLGRGLFSEQQSRILSVTLGSVFIIHAVFCTIIAFSGFLNWWIGGVLFFLMYLTALRTSRARMNSALRDSLPALVEEPDGVYNLEVSGQISGRILLTGETGSAVTAETISIESMPHEFLKQLETVMKRRGMRSITVDCWIGDEIELEMQGYTCINGKWRKRL